MNPQHLSKSNEWFTPHRYIEAARKVLGKIDLDPASCYEAQAIVQADHFFTKEDDGLSQKWHGNVFLNPPYGRGKNNRSNQDIWSKRICVDYMECRIESGILLVNAATGSSWFQRLFRYPICFVSPRIRFISSNGKQQTSPTHSNVFVYLGRDDNKFYDVFSSFGYIYLPEFL